MTSRYETVLSLMMSNETSLRELAKITDIPAFRFYQGASLTNLDLSGQDLTGLNFDGADLRFSNLDDIDYDPGAFNGSTLDNAFQWLSDEYEFFIQDILAHPIEEILVFCRFRPELLETCLVILKMNYRAFSERSAVGEASLRKARNNGIVAFGTAVKIINALTSILIDVSSDISNELYPILSQPVVQVLSGGINSDFKHVSRRRLDDLIKMRAELEHMRRSVYPNIKYDWRETPESLEQSFAYYKSDHSTLTQ